jgi:biopolymer transport protein ExbB/TolQ
VAVAGPALAVLALLSIVSVAVMLERAAAFRRASRGLSADIERVRAYLRQGRLAEARAALPASGGSLAARVIGAGLAELDGTHADSRSAWFDRLEWARGAMSRVAAAGLDALETRLGVLGTLGSISPFVGLLFTVVGIMRAFQAIGTTGSGGLATVSAGIAEALVATAAGLFVAIPAVVAYNYFVGRLRALALALENATGEVIDLASRAVAGAPPDSAPRPPSRPAAPLGA